MSGRYSSVGSRYSSLPSEDKPEHSENILQRVAKSLGAAAQSGMKNMSPLGVSVNPKFPFMPQMPTDSPALSSGMDEAQMPITKGNPWAQAGMGIASNLLASTFPGGGAGAVAKKAGEGISNLKNPSAFLGKNIEKIQGQNNGKGVNFLDIISRHQGDQFVDKVLEKSGVLEKFGGSTMDDVGAVTDNLSNLPLQKSQDLINDIKVGLTNTLKEGNYKSNQRGLASLLTNLGKAQESVFPGYKGAKSAYGFAKNVGKAVSKTKKTAITGAALGAGGTLAHSFVKSMVGNK